MKKPIATGLCLLLALTACTPSFGQDNAGATEETVGDTTEVPLEDATTKEAVAEETATSTTEPPSQAAQPTATPGPIWAGTWNIAVFGTSNSAYGTWQETQMTCTETGQDVLCPFSAWGSEFSIFATMGENPYDLYGNMRRPPQVWSTRFQKLGPNQFFGSWWVAGQTEKDGLFCGARFGAPMPEQCDH